MMKFQFHRTKEQSSPGGQKLRRAAAALVAAAVLGGGAAGYARLSQSKPPQTEQQTAAAVRQDLIRTLTGTGTLAPVEQFKITPLVTGKVLECTFEEGDRVEQGQLLYRIDPTEAQKNIEQAQLALRQSQLAMGQQTEDLGKLTVRTEEGGVVTETFVKEGDNVEAGAKLATIRNGDVMLLTLSFNATEAAAFTVGQAASIIVNGSLETLPGTVKEVDAVETVMNGFRRMRKVTLSVKNPGALSPAAKASAMVGNVSGDGSANLKYSAEETLTAGVAGKILQLKAVKGAKLAPGAVAVKITSSTLQNQQESNEIAIQQALVNMKNAETGLESYNLTAPISGTVVSREVKGGDSLGSGSGTSAMAVIYDLSALIFTIPLDELDMSRVSVGQPVEIRVDALEGRTFQGEVTKISMLGATEKGRTAYPVTVKIQDPPRELMPGMNVNASIVVAKAENALTVPVTAVQYGGVAYVRDQPGKAYPAAERLGAPEGFHTVQVETGISDVVNVEIKSGLQEGDEVYVSTEGAPTQEEGMDDEMMYG